MSILISPFKFLDAYGQGDRGIFFGREQETNELYQALSGVKHLLVYGPLGAGKTSLIECGLRNRFSDADWFALTIRRGANITDSVFAAINEALSGKIPIDATSKRPIDKDLDFGQAVEVLFGERYQPVYLLFDQFEELLISGSNEEKTEFFERLNQLVRYKTPCRVLLIMREEFIGHLSEFEPLCPSLFQHRFRVEKMRKDKVKEVMHNTLVAPYFHAYFRVENIEPLAERILDRLPGKDREIELAHVQVFLSELWERAAKVGTGDSLPVLHEGLVHAEDNLTGVLDSFLKKQLSEMGKTYGDKMPLEALTAMISKRDTKLQVSAEDLQQELRDKNVLLRTPLLQLLQDFERRRILRTLRSGEQTQYEISHDVLALVVGRNRTQEMQLREKAREIYQVYEGKHRLFSREELDDLRPFERYLTPPDSLQKRMRESQEELERKQQEEIKRQKVILEQAMWLLASVFIFLFVAIGAFIYAVKQNKIAEEQIFRSAVIAMQTKTTTELYDPLRPTDIYYDSITELSFSGFELRKIPIQVFKCKNLASLDLSNNRLSKLSRRIEELSELTELNLDRNKLSNLPHQIQNLKKLKILGLSANQFNSPPQQIWKLKGLTALYMNSNNLISIPSDIAQLENLTELRLIDNKLKKLPNEIGELSILIELDLSKNLLEMDSLPPQIGELKNLISLNLSSNRLTGLPPQIEKLKLLTSLDLSKNAFYNLPPQIGEMEKLVNLNVSANELSSLTLPVTKLKNLALLNLSNNKLTRLPQQITELKNLTNLYLSQNQLQTMPPQIGDLANLVELDLSFNQVQKLPWQIWGFKNLKRLGLSGNKIDSLPLQLWELKYLNILMLNGNQLRSLPPEIRALNNLSELDLSGNRIDSLPPQVRELKSLKRLYLLKNPIPVAEHEKIREWLPDCKVEF